MSNNSNMKQSSTKQQRLSLYTIEVKYVRDLQKKDDRVRSVSPQTGKSTRAFLGIIVICGTHKYCIPLSHAKPKHKNMGGAVDFSKILDGKGKTIAVLNFNLMIPVESPQLQKLDIKIYPSDTPKAKQYKKLCQRELDWCQKNSTDIINKANVLYQLYKSNEPFRARTRCLDFPMLEDICKKYNRKHFGENNTGIYSQHKSDVLKS